MNWKGGTVESATFNGSYQSWDWGMLGSLRKYVVENCASRNEAKGCKCHIVDENDKNVLQVPDDFYQRVAAAAAARRSGEAAPSRPMRDEREETAWAMASASSDPKIVEDFLRAFPNGNHAAGAQTRLVYLGANPAQPAAAQQAALPPQAADPKAKWDGKWKVWLKRRGEDYNGEATIKDGRVRLRARADIYMMIGDGEIDDQGELAMILKFENRPDSFPLKLKFQDGEATGTWDNGYVAKFTKQ
jgi:hypothetical protein